MNIYERLFKLWSMICKMVMDGVRDPKKVADILQAIIDEPVIGAKNYLHRFCVVKLGATDGTDNYETAKKVFRADCDSDFKRWGIVFSGIAPEMDIAVEELVLDGKFLEFLGNTAEKLERRRMLGAQLVKFCENYPSKLRQGGYATFAVLTKNDEPVTEDLSNIFVACVRVFGRGQLCANVFRFDYVYPWSARYRRRVLSPQQ